MSNYGHYTDQYYGNTIDFPKESFKITGISKYTNNCENITHDTELIMEPEPTNSWDPNAISILNNDKQIGYVPKELCVEMKQFSKINNDYSLKILNIKRISGNYGIRVIHKKNYTYDPILENKTLF